MNIEDIWLPDKNIEAEGVYGTISEEHPGVYHLYNNTNDYYVGGQLENSALPPHHEYRSLRLTPAHLQKKILR